MLYDKCDERTSSPTRPVRLPTLEKEMADGRGQTADAMQVQRRRNDMNN